MSFQPIKYLIGIAINGYHTCVFCDGDSDGDGDSDNDYKQF